MCSSQGFPSLNAFHLEAQNLGVARVVGVLSVKVGWVICNAWRLVKTCLPQTSRIGGTDWKPRMKNLPSKGFIYLVGTKREEEKSHELILQ